MPRINKGLSESLALYFNAVSFHSASMVLSKQPEQPLFIWPAVVNEAFALELFLKCLHLIRRRRKRGHDVQKLFNTLSQKDRLFLTRRYNQIVARHPLAQKFLEAGISLDVGVVLQRTRNAFTVIRYWHEGKPPSADEQGFMSNAGAGSLSDAVRDLIRELRPNWDSIEFKAPAIDLAISVFNSGETR